MLFVYCPSIAQLFTQAFVLRPSSQHTRGNQSCAAGNELKFPALDVLPHLHIQNCWRENTSLHRPGRHRHRKIWLRKIEAPLNIHQNRVLWKANLRNCFDFIAHPYLILNIFIILEFVIEDRDKSNVWMRGKSLHGMEIYVTVTNEHASTQC